MEPTYSDYVKLLRAGEKPCFPTSKRLAENLKLAQELDAQDPLSHLRDQFIFPTKYSLKQKAATAIPPTTNNNATTSSKEDATKAIYLCGNSLGLQPKTVKEYLNAQLETWSSLGVYGHFSARVNSPLASWQDMAQQCAKQSAHIVGARPDEIVIMNSLTVNLHLLLASFYRPTKDRHEIILETKAFPSDQYAIQSHLKWHGLNPSTSMVEMTAPESSPYYLSTSRILETIDAHATSAALILLPGLQYYTGQLFDIPRITAHAHKHGLVVGWDLAHAAGNVELQLHDWDVDFAAWCTYKYLNAGPGAIGGVFVHDRHGKVEQVRVQAPLDASGENHKGSDEAYDAGTWVYHPRLAGWYGNDKSVRFNMDKTFQPTPGAAGFQISNPSAIDLASLSAALSVFEKTNMQALRDKSLLLTAYAEALLDDIRSQQSADSEADDPGAEGVSLRIITPKNPNERGAQLSLLLHDGVLDKVGDVLKEAGVVCDQRKPNVIRVSPVPMYNSFEDVWEFIRVLRL